jgi:MFS family permease
VHKRYLIYGLLFLMTFLGYFDHEVLSVSLPTISKAFGLTPVSEGYILSAFAWSLLVLKVPGGALLDWFGTRRFTAASVMFWSAATAATALCPNFASLFITQVPVGVGQAPMFPAAVRAIRDWGPLKERAVATAVMMSGTSFGVATSAIVIGWLLSWMGWQGAFTFAGALGVIWVD